MYAMGISRFLESNSSGPSLGVSIVASFKCMNREDWEKYVLDPSSWGPAPEEATTLVCKWVKA